MVAKLQEASRSSTIEGISAKMVPNIADLWQQHDFRSNTRVDKRWSSFRVTSGNGLVAQITNFTASYWTAVLFSLREKKVVLRA